MSKHIITMSLHEFLDRYDDAEETIEEQDWIAETPGAALPDLTVSGSKEVVLAFPTAVAATLFKLRWM